MQIMISTSTHGIFHNLDELSRFLDVLKEAHRKRHLSMPCWDLLGRGHLFALGFDVCSSLLSARHQPTFW